MNKNSCPVRKFALVFVHVCCRWLWSKKSIRWKKSKRSISNSDSISSHTKHCSKLELRESEATFTQRCLGSAIYESRIKCVCEWKRERFTLWERVDILFAISLKIKCMLRARPSELNVSNEAQSSSFNKILRNNIVNGSSATVPGNPYIYFACACFFRLRFIRASRCGTDNTLALFVVFSSS